jgi:hypothetical protein
VGDEFHIPRSHHGTQGHTRPSDLHSESFFGCVRSPVWASHCSQSAACLRAFVAGNTGILYGDFNEGYLLRTDGDLSIRRLDERFADSLEVAFLAYARVAGASTDAGTHPILKLATHS